MGEVGLHEGAWRPVTIPDLIVSTIPLKKDQEV